MLSTTWPRLIYVWWVATCYACTNGSSTPLRGNEAQAGDTGTDASSQNPRDIAPSDAGGAQDSAQDGAVPNAQLAAECSAEAPEHYGNVVGFTPRVVAHLRSIAKQRARNDDVFMKVGDSITAGTGPRGSFGCFSHFEREDGAARLDLAENDALLPTIQHFDRVEFPLADGQVTTSWDRESTAAREGASSDFPLNMSATQGFVPLFHEEDVTNARFAVVMLGTNDVGGSPLQYGLGARGLREYAHNFWRIVDGLESNGVIPLLTYIPPVNSSTEPYRRWFSAAYVAVLRGVASVRQVPTIDFYTEMAVLGSAAYLPNDPLHPNEYPESPCIFSAEALHYGHNLRNLRTLEVLDKARRSVLLQEPAADMPVATVCGRGSQEAPFVVPSVPFAVGVSFSNRDNRLADYSRCGGQSGAIASENVFKLDVKEGTPVRAIVVPTTGACDPGSGKFTACDASRDVNISLFKSQLDAADCIRSHSTLIEQYLDPGTWYVVVDAFAADRSEPTILTIHRCTEDDPACQPHP